GSCFITFLYKTFFIECPSSSELIISIAVQSFSAPVITFGIWVSVRTSFISRSMIISFSSLGCAIIFWPLQNICKRIGCCFIRFWIGFFGFFLFIKNGRFCWFFIYFFFDHGSINHILSYHFIFNFR